MRLLLDTHVFLWFITADRRLPGRFVEAIRNPANEAFLSVASTWEIVIKHGIGKLRLPSPADVYVPTQRLAHKIADLSIDEAVMPHLAALPLLHRDPFDRLLVAQAKQHGLSLLTVDPAVLSYGVETLPPA
ncbi:MAG: type II toxin-antitoxin system VapC family toxin [Planctomycetota bacterium]